jgi:hypothetical protein
MEVQDSLLTHQIAENIMSEKILVTTKDLQVGDIFEDNKIVDVIKHNGFVLAYFEDAKSFSFSENIQVTIRRDSVWGDGGNLEA